jgi:hypothetical protein
MLGLTVSNSNLRLIEAGLAGRVGVVGAGNIWGTRSCPEFLYPLTTLPPRAAGLVFLRENLDREMKSSHPSPRARFHGRRRAAV